MGSKDDREQHLPRWGSTGNDEQHWRWATLAIGTTDNDGAALMMGSITDNDGAAKTMGNTDD